MRFSPMRSLLVLAVSLILFATLHGEDDEPRRKKGGFTGVTPKPVAKKADADEATPRPKRLSDDASTPRPKKASADDATPRPKKSADEESTPRPKKSTSEESTPKPKKFATDESTPAPKKRKVPGDSTASDEKKTEGSDKKTESAEKKSEAADKPLKSADAETTPMKREHAPAATIEPTDLAEFAAQPPRVQALIAAALELTKLNLTYTYGSADPSQGGMDCSGTMHHLLASQGFKDVPRDSSSQYVWARKAGPFFAVVSKSAESFEFKDLQPGDLLFWTGTYETGREIPISHVMLYLGTEKKRKKRVMFGSSDGRSYDGIQRWGVSVFDFKMPNGNGSNGEPSKVDFVGYGRIPQLHNASEVAAAAVEEKETPPVNVEATPAPKRNATGVSRSSTKSSTKKHSN